MHHTGFILILLQSNIQMENILDMTILITRVSKVKLNQKVHAGEEISKVGMTGYTYIPHLHFQVYVYTGYNIWTDFETIEINNFKNML